MSTTHEMYDFLTRAHGITNDDCPHCLTGKVEVYQCDWEGCYICWCLYCTPTIDPYREDDISERQ